MRRQNHFHFLYISSLLLLDAGGLVVAFRAAYWTRFFSETFVAVFPPWKGIPDYVLYEQSLWALLPMFIVVFFYVGFYRDVLLSAYDELVLVLKGVSLCALLTIAMTFAYRGVDYSRLVIGLWTVYGMVVVYVLRELDKSLFRHLTARTEGPRHVLIIGKGKTSKIIQEVVVHQPFLKTTFLDARPDPQTFGHYCKTHRITDVLLIQAAFNADTILDTAKLCEGIGVPCQILPDLLEMRRGEIVMDGFCGLPTFTIRSLSLTGSNYVLKRSFDVIISICVLLLFSPILVLISILIRLDSSGPILFTQDRMGFLGQKFKLFKFRTMSADADQQIEKLKHLSDRSGPVFKMKNDPRITRTGKWLRRFSLDEIPQILNVLRGDMSLVGPRPQVLWEAAHYNEHAKKRLRVKPGITGLWQVSGRASLSYDEMIDLDVFYLENWSLGLDLKILLRTLPAVFAKEGAY